MLIRLCVFVVAVLGAFGKEENHSWDMAVAINDQVQLLDTNGTLIGIAIEQFTKLKALTYDGVRHQFVVSDMDQQNDTIFTVHLTKETDITPIIQDLPDDVQGLTIDPISDILYWTDSINKTINYVSLNDPSHKAGIFMEFKNESPQDIAIDSCRRYIYWTNSDIVSPSIERVSIDKKQREVLIKDDLFMPAGIAVDYVSKRIYWADMREGIYYRIESTDFDGKDRKVLFEGTHQKPFGIGVDGENVYWTDVNNNALWRKHKHLDDVPQKIRSFSEKPMGLVMKNVGVSKLPDCHKLAEVEKNMSFSSTEYFETITEVNNVFCLHGGILTDDGCKCKRGFTGAHCETSILCYNYCVHGSCYFSSSGYPQCRCPKGFGGSRCERNICDGFCLNEGVCNVELRIPQCSCPEGFTGQRCEKSTELSDLCTLICQNDPTDVLVDKNNNLICRCNSDTFAILDSSNLTASQLSSQPTDYRTSFLEHFRDPGFVISLACMSFVMLLVIIALSVTICKLRRRPRIKKRFVVNKSITPLSYRQQPPTELCEVTIENCCNMNVCETPCFEPPQLRFPPTKRDEKKMLLDNMENGEEIY